MDQELFDRQVSELPEDFEKWCERAAFEADEKGFNHTSLAIRRIVGENFDESPIFGVRDHQGI